MTPLPVQTFQARPRSAGARAALALLAAALLAGCATAPAVQVSRLPEAAACASIAALPPPPQAAPSVLDQRLLAATLRALAEAGHDTTAAAPACWVGVTTTRIAAPAPGVRLGIGGGAGGATVGVGFGIAIPVGGGVERDLRLEVSLVDAQRRLQVWSGQIERAFASAVAPTDEEIDRAVQAIVAQISAPGAR
jgi:hypothetical protein